MYSFAQLGNQPGKPGCLKSEAVAYPSDCSREDHIRDVATQTAEVSTMTFDLASFLEEAGVGRRVVQLKPKQVFFSQGSSADSIFYL